MLANLSGVTGGNFLWLQALENARQLKFQLECISNAETTKEAMDLAQSIETVYFRSRLFFQRFNLYFNGNLSCAMTRKFLSNAAKLNTEPVFV